MKQWGVNGFRATSKKLSSLVDVLDLHNLPLQGTSFTYYGSGQNIARNRIDRFLILEGACVWFSNFCQRAILPVVLDYFPILSFFGDL